MRALIVGGGKVGYYLLRTLKDRGYKITLIERDKQRCEFIAEEPDVNVICGDGTDIDVLRDAGIEEMEVVAAVTGKDEENFVICQIVKINFNIEIIARINNPKNRKVFKSIGVKKTVCSTEVIANLIEGELTSENLNVVQALHKGRMVLLETTVTKDTSWVNKDISSLNFPEGCVIVSIFRDDETIAPKGNILIKEGDRVLVVADIDKKDKLERNLMEG